MPKTPAGEIPENRIHDRAVASGVKVAGLLPDAATPTIPTRRAPTRWANDAATRLAACASGVPAERGGR